MARLTVLLIFFTYFVGILSASPLSALNTITKITITHTHRVSDHNHDQANQEDEDHHHDHESAEQHPDSFPHEHSHEILIVGVGYCLPAIQQNFIRYPALAVWHPTFANQKPPEDLFLNSIFRPPIANSHLS